MGMLDFLKVAVNEKKKKATVPAKAGNFLIVDNKSFPLLVLTPRGAVAGNFDGSLIKGQRAQITVQVSDAIAQFTFSNTVLVVETKDGKVGVEFNILPVELENRLKQYGERKKKG